MDNSIVRFSELFCPVSGAGIHSFSSPISSRTTEGSLVFVIFIFVIGVTTSLGEHIISDFNTLASGKFPF